MALKIQGVVKEAKDFDLPAVLGASDTEHDEMTPLASLAGDVQRANTPQDVISLTHTRDCRPARQISQRRRNRLGVDARLRFAELIYCPAQDFLEIGLGGRCQMSRPTAHPCAHFLRTTDFPPIAFSAMAVK